MQNVGIGDVIFIFLVLGLIHGVMYLIGQARKKKSEKDEATEPGN